MKKEMDKSFRLRNNSMVGDMEDMKRLGKQMENLRTNKEIREDNKIPDPIQK